VPVAAVVAFVIEVSCEREVKPFGPLQVYVAPAITVALRFKGEPAHIGPVLDAPGEAGIAFTMIAPEMALVAVPHVPLTIQ
jgi:hypothetical protein